MDYETEDVLWQVYQVHDSPKCIELTFREKSADSWQKKYILKQNSFSSRDNIGAPQTDRHFQSVCAMIAQIVRVQIWGKQSISEKLCLTGDKS